RMSHRILEFDLAAHERRLRATSADLERGGTGVLVLAEQIAQPARGGGRMVDDRVRETMRQRDEIAPAELDVGMPLELEHAAPLEHQMEAREGAAGQRHAERRAGNQPRVAGPTGAQRLEHIGEHVYGWLRPRLSIRTEAKL